jgi:hypothetical protein
MKMLTQCGVMKIITQCVLMTLAYDLKFEATEGKTQAYTETDKHMQQLPKKLMKKCSSSPVIKEVQ